MTKEQQIEQGIFPITNAEAAILHDIGWSSGYGWQDSWDWWRTNLPSEQQMESRETNDTKRSFALDLIIIRTAYERSDEILRKHLINEAQGKTGALPLEEYHEDMGPVTWWCFPIEEAAWIGTPNDSDWPGYHTHFTPHPLIPEQQKPESN